MYLCITVAVENQDEKPLVFHRNKKWREKYLMEKKRQNTKKKYCPCNEHRSFCQPKPVKREKSSIFLAISFSVPPPVPPDDRLGLCAYLDGVQDSEDVIKLDSKSSQPHQSKRPCDAQQRKQDHEGPGTAPWGKTRHVRFYYKIVSNIKYRGEV